MTARRKVDEVISADVDQLVKDFSEKLETIDKQENEDICLLERNVARLSLNDNSPEGRSQKTACTENNNSDESKDCPLHFPIILSESTNKKNITEKLGKNEIHDKDNVKKVAPKSKGTAEAPFTSKEKSELGTSVAQKTSLMAVKAEHTKLADEQKILGKNGRENVAGEEEKENASGSENKQEDLQITEKQELLPSKKNDKQEKEKNREPSTSGKDPKQEIRRELAAESKVGSVSPATSDLGENKVDPKDKPSAHIKLEIKDAEKKKAVYTPRGLFDDDSPNLWTNSQTFTDESVDDFINSVLFSPSQFTSENFSSEVAVPFSNNQSPQASPLHQGLNMCGYSEQPSLTEGQFLTTSQPVSPFPVDQRNETPVGHPGSTFDISQISGKAFMQQEINSSSLPPSPQMANITDAQYFNTSESVSPFSSDHGIQTSFGQPAGAFDITGISEKSYIQPDINSYSLPESPQMDFAVPHTPYNQQVTSPVSPLGDNVPSYYPITPPNSNASSSQEDEQDVQNENFYNTLDMLYGTDGSFVDSDIHDKIQVVIDATAELIQEKESDDSLLQYFPDGIEKWNIPIENITTLVTNWNIADYQQERDVLLRQHCTEGEFLAKKKFISMFSDEKLCQKDKRDGDTFLIILVSNFMEREEYSLETLIALLDRLLSIHLCCDTVVNKKTMQCHVCGNSDATLFHTSLSTKNSHGFCALQCAIRSSQSPSLVRFLCSAIKEQLSDCQKIFDVGSIPFFKRNLCHYIFLDSLMRGV